MKKIISNEAPLQSGLIFLIIIICILQVGCKKEKPDFFHNLIAEGCVPNTVNLNESHLGGYNDVYKYENGRLTGFGYFRYEYEDGLVKRIRLGENRYEEYFYNNEFKVIQSIQYWRDDQVEGFIAVDDKTYLYNDSLIFEVIDNDDNITHKISYYPNTSNIDSIKTFNSNFELTEVNTFKYDQFNNVFKNLLMPKYNFFWWIEKGSDNNVTEHKIVKLLPADDTIIFYNSFKYNDYNYPIEINGSKANSTYTTKTTISYVNCE